MREGRYRIPRIVVDTRLVSQLSEIRKLFPKMTMGVCDSDLAARAFAEANLRVVVVGGASVGVGNVTRVASWDAVGVHPGQEADRGPQPVKDR